MSAVDPFAPGKSLLHYRLVERVTSSVWKAEDTRSGKPVALKILSRQLPKDPTKRDTLVREVRQGAALYHSFLANIVEIVTAGDALLLIMEWVDGKPLTMTVRGKALDRAAFFRLAYQIVDATKLLHAKNVIHGNIAGDSILITASGMAKLSGLNLTNLMPRREGQISAFQQKGNDARAVGYMAPEQITNQPVSPQTDIFSLGLVLYETATGRLPYQAPTAGEIARKVVDEQPPSPKSINPAIDNAVLGVIGRALFKDPFRRHKDAKAMLDEIVRADPIAVRLLLHAGEVETHDGAVVGPGVTRAVEVLRHLPPLKLHITEDFTKRGRGNVRMRDSGARGGVKLYTIVPPEPKPQSVEPIESSMDVAAEQEAAEAVVQEETKRKGKKRLGAVVAAVVIVVVLPGAASGIRSLVHWVADQLHIPQRGDTTPEAYNALADAVTAGAANDVPKTEAALRAATKADPNFLPAELPAMRFFTAQGKDVDAIAAARQVMAANPNDLEAARVVARGSMRVGDLAAALGPYGSILRLKPSDPEALNIIGRYAVSAADRTTFSKVLQRLSTLPDVAEVHEPDMLLASGKIEAASDAYYTIEEKVTN